jgi:hypothetical protein
MTNKLILYHGSERIIQQPIFGEGKKHNDFGLGFYCTEELDLAKEWACSSVQSGFANKYRMELDGLNILNLNTAEYTILNWLSVLVNNRLFRIRNPIAGKAKKYLTENFYVNVAAYDAVIGYRADDSYFDFADAFLNNAITVEQLSRAMRLGKLGEQFVLKSQFAFNQIKFIEAIPAEKSIYYPVRKARNDEAEQNYVKLSNEDADGLYMIDIIRGEVKNDDERIPRNLS